MKKTKDILFPRFSEIQLITLFYLVILLLIDQRAAINQFIFEEFFSALQINNLFENFKLFLSLTVFLLFIVMFFPYLFINTIKQKRLTSEQKSSYSSAFYILLSTFSLLSLFELSAEGTNSLFSIFEGIILLYLMIRSLITILLTFILSKSGKESIYSGQMTDEQIQRKDIFFIILLSPIFYFYLRFSYSLFPSLSLSYFYVVTLILTFRKFADKIVLH